VLCYDVAEYVIEAREENLVFMTTAQDYQSFFYFKGKVYAYNEILRVLEED